jgi:hypothetical protein
MLAASEIAAEMPGGNSLCTSNSFVSKWTRNAIDFMCSPNNLRYARARTNRFFDEMLRHVHRAKRFLHILFF